jgi:hypothetical protein
MSGEVLNSMHQEGKKYFRLFGVGESPQRGSDGQCGQTNQRKAVSSVTTPIVYLQHDV